MSLSVVDLRSWMIFSDSVRLRYAAIRMYAWKSAGCTSAATEWMETMQFSSFHGGGTGNLDRTMLSDDDTHRQQHSSNRSIWSNDGRWAELDQTIEGGGTV